MDDKFPPDENSAKADFVVPEAGPGEEAANFSAKAQQEQFLGGGGRPEIKPQPKTAEQKTYRPDQQLTEMEKRTEGNNLIRRFVDIFKDDPDVQKEVIAAYFRYGEQGGPSSNTYHKRGAGEYSLNTISEQYTHDSFRIQRTEGRLRETLDIKIGRLPIDPASINYNAYDTESGFRMAGLLSRHKGEINEKDNGTSVNKARELLAKTQKDFGKELNQNNPPIQST